MSYSDFDFDDPTQLHQRGLFQHAGFRVGALGGIVMWSVHLILLLIFQGTNQGDFLAWIIQLFVYYFLGRTAAEKHYHVQRKEVEALRGVQASGTGAALVTSLLVWLYIILRGIIRDAIGFMILVEPLGLFCVVVIDVLIAMGLGSWGGKAIVKKHQTFIEPY